MNYEKIKSYANIVTRTSQLVIVLWFRGYSFNEIVYAMSISIKYVNLCSAKIKDIEKIKTTYAQIAQFRDMSPRCNNKLLLFSKMFIINAFTRPLFMLKALGYSLGFFISGFTVKEIKWLWKKVSEKCHALRNNDTAKSRIVDAEIDYFLHLH